jgi:hypothetical protein
MLHMNTIIRARRNMRAVLLLVGVAASVGIPAATITVEGSRPVAKVVENLIEKYGYAITYEDPRYAYEEDLKDVAAQVRKDFDKYPPGQAPKTIVPKGGALTVSYSTEDPASILNQVVQTRTANGARFHVERTGDYFHIVPTERRDAEGRWEAHNSVLEIPISLVAHDRTEREMIQAICDAVSENSDVRIILGGKYMVITGFAEEGAEPKRLYRMGADNEPARKVLLRALESVGKVTGERLTWLMYYDFGLRKYALNVIPIPDRSSTAVKPKISPAPQIRGEPTSVDPRYTAPSRK